MQHNMKSIIRTLQQLKNQQQPNLSHVVASGSEITPCNKIDKPLVVYRLVHKVIMSIIMLRKRWQNLDINTPKM